MLKIVCVPNDVKQKVESILLDYDLYFKGENNLVLEKKIDDLEVIDELLFNSPPDLEIEITLGNGKIIDRERAKRMREERGFDLR